MGILSGGSTGYFDKQLENATSQLQLEPNWQAILDICDCIRQKDVPAKYAVQSIKRKAFDKNPHVSKFALVVLEACMKNCGSLVHDEVSNKDFMDDLRSLAKNGSAPVKEQVLSLLQAWNNAFRNKPTYKIFQDTYDLMKMEGYDFPGVAENDAMFSAETAPEWAEGDVCNMCRVKFSAFTRQHHCRCCGQVFCGKCSSKTSIIPKFGIEKEVRVCDPCYDSLNPPGAQGPSTSTSSRSKGEDRSDLPSEYLNHPLSKEAQVKPKASEDDLKAQEEEELQLAMALSLSAQETDKPSQGSKKWTSLSAATSSQQSASAPPAPYQEAKSDLYSEMSSKLSQSSESTDPELSRYLNRSYWEQKKQEKIKSEPSAPLSKEDEETVPVRSQVQRYVPGASDNEDDGSEVFVQTMRNSLSMFMERMQNVSAEGKHIAMDTSVQSLFQSLSAMHPQLMRLVEDQENLKAKHEAMLEKIALIREARESLDDVRAHHKEKLRQQELEQEMLRRMQMEQKLELMRQQKQEYLEYQRQLQIQRQQDLEVQQQLKMQQKQMVQQVAGPYSTAMGMDPAVARQYQGYGQYTSAAEGSIGNSLPGAYAPQEGGQLGGSPVSDQSGVYSVNSNYPQYSGPSYTGPMQMAPGSYAGLDQQPSGLEAPHRSGYLPQQHPQGGYKAAVPASSTYEAVSGQAGGHQGQGVQTSVQQPISPASQAYEPGRGSQVAVSNLLDAPIGNESGAPPNSYSPPNYGMSGPHSQDFNQRTYAQHPGSQGHVAYPEYQGQPPVMTSGQPMMDSRLQGQAGQVGQVGQSASFAQQQQQRSSLTSAQQPPQQNMYAQARFQGPLSTSESQGHVSPQAPRRMLQPYGGQQQPSSLQYTGLTDQGVVSRGGAASLPPNINAYASGGAPPGYHPQDGMAHSQGFMHAHSMQQQQQPIQQQHQHIQQQHQHSMQQLQQHPQQYGPMPTGSVYGSQPTADAQQEIPPNSHLRDMALISFD